MKIKEGYIYIMTLSDMETRVKIGQTQNHPEVRAKDLSKHESTTSTFKPILFIKVPDVISGERMAHLLFQEIRVNNNKEYFELNDDFNLKYVETEMVIQIIESFKLQNKEDKGVVFWDNALLTYKDAYYLANSSKKLLLMIKQIKIAK